MRQTCFRLLTLWLPLCLSPPALAADEQPPRFEVSAPPAEAPLVFITYGDTRFSKREDIVNSLARRALVNKMAEEQPAAIFIGGDLVYAGSDPDDYEVYKSETAVWTQQKIPVFPALGNHEFKGCSEDADPCLQNWWNTFSALSLRPHRWYSATLGTSVLALMLDSDAPLKPGSEQLAWFASQVVNADTRVKFILVILHHPPVPDPVYPSVFDEKQVARYLNKKAASLRAQVIVIGSHVHNYERYFKHGVTYLISGGGGATPVPAFRLLGERSRLTTSVNFHYLRFTLANDRLTGTMVRFDADNTSGNPWTEPDHFVVKAKF
jgi:acid phosphatase type 7